MSDDSTEIYRMPLGFGPAPGPRQAHDGTPTEASATETLTASVWAKVDGVRLQRVLPSPFELTQDTLIVDVKRHRNVAWLSGRGYNIVAIRIPARLHSDAGTMEGHYQSVLWENRPEPIITGREELGYAKLFADIEDLCTEREPVTTVRSEASWDDHPFFTFSVENLTPYGGDLRGGQPLFHYKFIPATGRWGESDVSYPVVTPSADPAKNLLRAWVGSGSFEFRHSTFEQLPTMFHIVSALAEMRVGSYLHSQVTLTIGGKTLRDQAPVVVGQTFQAKEVGPEVRDQ